MHKMHKEEEVPVARQKESNRNFDSVSMKSLTFHRMKSVIFTKVESGASQKRAKIACKIDIDSDGDLMPFRVFRILFPRSTVLELNATINRSLVLKMYNQSNIEQLGRCSVSIRHNHKGVKCRFLLVVGNISALFWMPVIALLGIIQVLCKTIDNKTNDRKSDVQTRYADSQDCGTYKDLQTKLESVDNMSGDKTSISNYLNSSTNKTHMPDYFHSGYNKEADMRVRETITNRIHNEFNDLISGIGCFEDMFPLQVKDGTHPYQAQARRVAYVLQQPLKEELEWLQKQQIIVPLGVDKASE